MTPSDTVRLDREKVLAFATESGGKESPAAIRDMAFDNWQIVATTACSLASPEEIDRLIEHEKKSLPS